MAKVSLDGFPPHYTVWMRQLSVLLLVPDGAERTAPVCSSLTPESG